MTKCLNCGAIYTECSCGSPSFPRNELLSTSLDFAEELKEKDQIIAELLESLEAITESIRLGRVISMVSGGTYSQAMKAIRKAKGEMK